MTWKTYKPGVCFALAVWMSLHSCAFGLCHRHEQGEDRHFHGLGLASNPWFQQTNPTTNNLAHQAWHFHVVFLGLEIHLLPDHNCSLAFYPRISLLGEKHFLPQLLETNQESWQASDSLCLLDLALLELPLTRVDFDLPTGLTKESLAISEMVCELALRICSGTQRI